MIVGTVSAPLDRVFLQFGPFTIYWYGVLIGLGILLGVLLAMREAERRGLNKDIILDLVMITVPVAIVFARAYYVLFNWSYYSENPGMIIQIWNGGLAIHGGLIGAIFAGYLFARYQRVSFWKLADIVAPSIILGQAIGRWGNFMNQEAHGGEVSRAFLENLFLPDWIINQMYINVNGTYAYYQPTFLYESLWNIAGLLFLLWLRRRAFVRTGEVFLSYTIWYSIGRFFIEGLRTDSLMVTETLRAAQVLSLSLVVIAIVVIIYRRKAGYAKKSYLEV